MDTGRRARIGLLVAELALHEHVLEHGRAPDTLAELVPRYLPAIPIDPYSGQPLVYRQRGDGYVLYSVGANGIDDGEGTQRAPYRKVVPGAVSGQSRPDKTADTDCRHPASVPLRQHFRSA